MTFPIPPQSSLAIPAVAAPGKAFRDPPAGRRPIAAELLGQSPAHAATRRSASEESIDQGSPVTAVCVGRPALGWAFDLSIRLFWSDVNPSDCKTCPRLLPESRAVR